MSKTLTFLYHEVTNNPEETGFQRVSANPYKHPIEEFNRNIEIIQNSNTEILTINEHKQFENNYKNILITFDDGGKSAKYAADFLNKKNIKAHFFISTSYIGNDFFLNEDEIRYVRSLGHIIGSHSHTHPNVFSSQSYDQMLQEWVKSKEILERILGEPITSCSVPGGDADSKTYTSAINAGYEFIFNSEPTYKIKEIGNSKIIGRVCPKKGTDYMVIEKLCKFKSLFKLITIRKSKNLLKKIIFPVYSRIHNNRKHEG